MSLKASGFRRKAIGNSACIHVIGMQNQNQQAEVHAQTERLHSLRMGLASFKLHSLSESPWPALWISRQNIQYPSHNTQRVSAFDNQGLWPITESQLTWFRSRPRVLINRAESVSQPFLKMRHDQCLLSSSQGLPATSLAIPAMGFLRTLGPNPSKTNTLNSLRPKVHSWDPFTSLTFLIPLAKVSPTFPLSLSPFVFG